MRPDRALPRLGFRIERVANLAPDLRRSRSVPAGKTVKPVILPERMEDIAHRPGSDFQRREGQLAAFPPLRHSLVDRAHERSGYRFAGLARFDPRSPDRLLAFVGRRLGKILGDHFTGAVLAETGMEVDHEETLHMGEIFFEDVAQHLRRPALARTAIVEAVRKTVLSPGDRFLERERSLLLGIGAQFRI